MTLSEKKINFFYDRADIYFIRSKEILGKEGLNPVVSMEFFGSRKGIFCGIKEVVEILSDILSSKDEIWAVEEGEKFEEKEIVLRIKAPYNSFGYLETSLLGILAHESGWASAARECVEATQNIPVISFGARHVHPDVVERMEYAAQVGGCAGAATTIGAQSFSRNPIGTIPHAMILIFNDTVKAALAFDKYMEKDVARVILIDTFKDEVEEARRVAKEMKDKLWGVRLDTPSERGGVTPDLVKEVRYALDREGCKHTKIVVSGGVNPEKIKTFIDEKAPVDIFGVGSYITKAPPIDFTADIKEINGIPITKRGRIPGITNNPKLKKIKLKG